MSVTRKQAEQVLQAVKQRYHAYLDSDGTHTPQPPQLVEDYDFYMGAGVGSNPAPFAVVWEEGPDGWAIRFVMGGVDEELALLTEEFVGKDEAAHLARAGQFTEEASQDPKGVHVDSITSWAVGIWED